MNLWQGIAISAATIGGSLLSCLYAFQEKLIYHPAIPTRNYENKPDDFGMDYVDVDIQTEDRVHIHAWLIKQQEPKDAATLIYFHGNAGNISHRLPDVRKHYQRGYNIFMVSYRGYGHSEGMPSERGLKLDAAAALQYARDRSDVLDTNRIFLFGRSIGAACAIALASTPSAQDCVRGLIVENTFTSIDDMIDSLMPALKFAKPFNRNKWNSLNAIKDIKMPVMFISGLQDELVPADHMKKLQESATKARFRASHAVENGHHNDTWWVGGSEYREAIDEFLRRVERGEE